LTISTLNNIFKLNSNAEANSLSCVNIATIDNSIYLPALLIESYEKD
jgi:hypothetical protein